MSPQANLSAGEWQAHMKDFQKAIIGKMDDLLMSGKLKPYDLTRNDLDNRAKDVTADLRNLAAATGALTDLDDSNTPLMDGCKALSDTVGDIFDMLTSVCEGNSFPSFCALIIFFFEENFNLTF